MTKTMMRVNKKLLEELKARKQVPRESYADVVERMIRNETAPTKIQKMLRESAKEKEKKNRREWNLRYMD